MCGTMMTVLVILLHPYSIIQLITTSIWEMKFQTPNNIKTTKIPRCSFYLQRLKRVQVNCRLGTVSHSFQLMSYDHQRRCQCDCEIKNGNHSKVALLYFMSKLSVGQPLTFFTSISFLTNYGNHENIKNDFNLLFLRNTSYRKGMILFPFWE